MHTLEEIRHKKGYICDMDGVIYHGNRLLSGVQEFVSWLVRENKSYLFLTNSSERSPLELRQKLERMGLSVDESHFYTSALATAKFLASQSPGCSAYVIGAPGLLNALYSAGIAMNEVNPIMWWWVRPELQLREHPAGGDLGAEGREADRHEPRYDRPHRGGHCSRLPGADRAHRACHRAQRLFCGQAQSADDAHRLRMLGVHSNEAVMSATAWTPTSSRASKPGSIPLWCCPA